MKNISIIGGDLRIVKLADMLKADGYEVYTYGIEQARTSNEIVKCTSIEEVTSKSDIIVSSIPLSSDGININTPFSKNKIEISEVAKYVKGKTFIAGRNKKRNYIKSFSQNKGYRFIKKRRINSIKYNILLPCKVLVDSSIAI